MKLILFTVLAVTWLGHAQNVLTNEVRDWTFTSGKTFSGSYVSANSAAVVVNRQGTNYSLPFQSLIPADRQYASAQYTAQAKAASAVPDTDKLKAAGLIELSPKLIENYPEKVDRKRGWMEGSFGSVGGDAKYHEEFNDMLGFSLSTEDGLYSRCVVVKNLGDHLDEKVMALKRDHKVRVIGKVVVPTGGRSQGWLMVENISELPDEK